VLSLPTGVDKLWEPHGRLVLQCAVGVLGNRIAVHTAEAREESKVFKHKDLLVPKKIKLGFFH
jgi:hypothetical protein